MKSVIILLSILGIGWNASAQENILPSVQSPRSDVSFLDSFYHWEWNDIDLIWKLKDRTRYGYDPYQNIDREISYVLDSLLQWIPQQLTLSDYDDDHHLLYEEVLQWNGTQFEKDALTTYTFDINHDQTGILFQNWADTGWVNAYQQVYTFDNNHTILTRVSQYWTGTDWGNSQRQEYTYDGNNRVAIRLFRGWNGNAWYDISRSLSTYDGDNNLDTLLYQKYLLSEWTDDYRNIYDYDDHHNRTLILEQLAVGIGIWEDRDKYEYTYDQYDNIVHLVNSQFDNTTWVYNYQYNLINDDFQNRVTEVFQTWDSAWVNQDSTQYYYTNLTGVNEIRDPHSIWISPNPANDQLNLSFEKEFDGRISVYTMQGIKVMDRRVAGSVSIPMDIASLQSGQYVIVLRDGKSVTAKAFQKL